MATLANAGRMAKKTLEERRKADIKIAQAAPGAIVKEEDPFGNQEWIKRKAVYQVANGADFKDPKSFNKEFIEVYHDETSSSDSDDEKKRVGSLESTNNYRFSADLKKRPAKVHAGLQAGKKHELPVDVKVVMDDMDDYMKDDIIKITRESIEKFPDEEVQGSLRAKFIKTRLDTDYQPSWMVACVNDGFWVGASFEPGHTFGFELDGIVYVVWRTPVHRI